MLVLCAHTKYSMTDNLVFLEIFNMIKFEKNIFIVPCAYKYTTWNTISIKLQSTETK